MLERFEAILAKAENHNTLVLLDQDGWEELMPTESYWSFVHPEFPGEMILWSPGWEKPLLRNG